MLALKIKTKSGQQVINSLTSESTIKDLKKELSNATNIPEGRLHILNGFPPKPFDISEDEALLGQAGLKSGDTLILEEKTVPTVAQEGRSHVADNCEFPGILMKHIVPADNSCLFSSIYFVLNGKTDETGTIAPFLRQVIAETVSKEPEKFSEAILGKPNAEYCKWIQDDTAWGGAIEVSILSDYYGIEIAVVDTINAIINRFGEDQNFAHRVLLLFDGIHYDPLYLEPLEVSHLLQRKISGQLFFCFSPTFLIKEN